MEGYNAAERCKNANIQGLFTKIYADARVAVLLPCLLIGQFSGTC
jgi:hypothetical protein